MDCVCRGLSLAGFALAVLALATADRGRERAAGDGQRRRARGEGGLVRRRGVPGDAARGAWLVARTRRARRRVPARRRGDAARVPARPRQPPGVSDRVVVRHRLRARRRRQRIRLAGHVLPQPAGTSPRTTRARSRRGRSCSRTRRWPIRAAAGCCTTSAPRARASGSPRRARTRPACGSATGRWQLADGALRRADRGARVRARPRVRADAGRAAAGRRRLLAQGPGRAAGELLLQPAAARGDRHASTVDGRRRRGHRHRLARPRVVERDHGAPRRSAGTGSASTSTTAAR